MKIEYSKHYGSDYFYPGFKIWTDQFGVKRKYYGPSKEWHGFWELVLFIKRHFPEVKLLHDIGCSAGSFVSYCHMNNIEADGVDISKFAIHNCIEGAKGKLWIMDITKCIPPGGYGRDMATAFDLMEHIYEKDLGKVMEYICKSIKPGGVFFADIATARAKHEVWSHTGPEDEVPEDKTWLAVAGHVNVRPMSYWIKKLESIGFKTMYDIMAKFQLWKEEESDLAGMESWSIRNVYFGRK